MGSSMQLVLSSQKGFQFAAGKLLSHTVNLGSEMWRHYRSMEKIYFGQL